MSCAALPVGLAGVRLTEEGKQAVEQASAGVGVCAGVGGVAWVWPGPVVEGVILSAAGC